MDPTAININYEATNDDGSCVFPEDEFGCTDETAFNYNPEAMHDDGSCITQITQENIHEAVELG